MTCSFEGCDRPRRANGLCSGHNRQRARGQQLRPLEPRRPQGSFVACSFEGCGRDQRYKGLCDGHAQQARAGRPLTPLRVVVVYDGCQFPGCRRPHDSHGWCAGHVRQFKAGERLRPLRSRSPNGTRDPEAQRRAWKASGKRRRERKAGAAGSASREQIEARIAYWGGMCSYCRERPHEHLDHTIPLSRGGSAWPANRRPSCRSCNQRKAAGEWRTWVRGEVLVAA